MAEGNRPAKRAKIDPGTITNTVTPGNSTSQHPAGKSQVGDVQSRTRRKSTFKRQPKSQGEQQKLQAKAGRSSIRTFSQPSVLCAGDKGIFVTCDKGCEKKALLEFHDLLQDYLETRDVNTLGRPALSRTDENGTNTYVPTGIAISGREDIEADIASELASLGSKGEVDRQSTDAPVSKPVQLITLDIPCLSFLRLPVGSTLDPVEIVHRLCLEAAIPNARQRSRYIKRLTPVSSIAKALSQGLEKVSNTVLPAHFALDDEGTADGIKFAIRPTIRENEQLNRESVIRPVAEHIQQLGKEAHKVDLKNYEKAVIVEVYRGWIGMCVVDNTSTGDYERGYNQLKRFNLAEIYASR